ncbi:MULTISPECIES: sigma D regulator [Cobetia]|uniref:sigma D regulator n=1 Tax=Cobetia TaxID=204286 RepID=UPI0015822B62|nr:MULTISPECIES: sigma D regulator [Cobetia]MDI4659788.1 sigma D regulator [Cobetia sp. BMC6]MDL2191714.1 sigma D regulator [Cobetia sp. LC6]NUJ55195.1 sigma D regulator [Cobetia marina]
MLEECTTAAERFRGVHQLVDRWLDQRREMLVCFMDLHEACVNDLDQLEMTRVNRFIELLMDYISAGHFEVYPQLKEEGRVFEDTAALAVCEQLMQRLEPSTELVLSFDEDFSSPTRCQHYRARLPEWLARLQQGLTERFALEDQLIQRLHAVHEPVAQSAPSGQSVS